MSEQSCIAATINIKWEGPRRAQSMRNYVLLIFFLSLNAQAIPPLPGKSLVVKDLFAVLQDILGGSVKEKNISGKTKDASTCIVWLNLQLRPGWGRNWYQMEFAVAP